MKLLQFLFALCIIINLPAKAAQSGDFTYTATATEVTISGYTGSGGAVTIPSLIAGLPVTSIGEIAFSPHYKGIDHLFPALRSGLMNLSGASRNKQIHSSQCRLRTPAREPRWVGYSHAYCATENLTGFGL